jgi:hypothetical protein
MSSLELLKEIEAWLCFNTEPSKEETAKLRKSINEHVSEQLRLGAVIESDCDHEWLNNSFDHFGFLQEQICAKCGAKQSVP